MRRLPPPDVVAEARLADGYASDDEKKPRPSPRGYGALQGDLPRRRPRLTEEEGRDYAIRRGSAGPPSTKVRYLDAVLGKHEQIPPHLKRQRPHGFAETRLPRASYEKHCKLLALLPKSNGPAKSDLQYLREAHRFLRDEEDDDGSWESKLAQKYYKRLFKEYVICDLAGYKKGNIGFRWRTEAEVFQGRGQFQCGHKRCISKVGLQSYEVDFKYCEAGADKRALVKVRLCEECAYKLHYRRLKAERKRRRKGKKDKKDVKSEAESVAVKSDSESGEGAADAEEADEQKSGAPSSSMETPTDADKRQLEALAWKGPDPEARTREDDFDDYFNDLLC